MGTDKKRKAPCRESRRSGAIDCKRRRTEPSRDLQRQVVPVTSSTWNVLGAQWSTFCHEHEGNSSNKDCVLLEWAHDGRKVNGWIEMLPRRPPSNLNTKWGRGEWRPVQKERRNGCELIEFSWGNARHFLKLERQGKCCRLVKKTALKGDRELKNAGTRAWPTSHTQDKKSFWIFKAQQL